MPGVDDIYVYGGENLTPPEYGRVYIAVKPKGSDSPSLTKTYIKKSLADYRVASIDIQLVDPVVLYVELDSIAYYDDKKTNKDASGVVAAVNSTMVQYGEADAVPSSVVLFATPAFCRQLMIPMCPSLATTRHYVCVVICLH